MCLGIRLCLPSVIDLVLNIDVPFVVPRCSSFVDVNLLCLNGPSTISSCGMKSGLHSNQPPPMQSDVSASATRQVQVNRNLCIRLAQSFTPDDMNFVLTNIISMFGVVLSRAFIWRRFDRQVRVRDRSQGSTVDDEQQGVMNRECARTPPGLLRHPQRLWHSQPRKHLSFAELLSNPLRRGYLPASSMPITFTPELMILLWRLLDECPVCGWTSCIMRCLTVPLG